jgi:hypothetical protein
MKKDPGVILDRLDTQHTCFPYSIVSSDSAQCTDPRIERLRCENSFSHADYCTLYRLGKQGLDGTSFKLGSAEVRDPSITVRLRLQLKRTTFPQADHRS